MKPICKIIGVLDNGIAGLFPAALQTIREAHVVIGGERTLALFANEISSSAKQHDLGGQLMQVPGWIQTAQQEQQSVVVLATGDPLCHGIARFLINKLGSEHIDIQPNVSTIQLACTRLGITWQEMKICSVHSKDAGEWQAGSNPEHGLYALLQNIKQHCELAILTSPENTPARIARMLQMEGMATNYRLSVVSHIAQADEKIERELNINDAATMSFADPNVVILQATTEAAAPTLFGLEDASFQQRKPEKGLITKREVRAVSLAMMLLHRNSVVWDIGAGSGSVGLEAARLCTDGHVYAMEKNEADVANAAANRVQMGITNYSLMHSKAPDGLESWPDPDAIFIGGSGGELAVLIELCLTRLRPQGVLVMNFITIENMALATETLKALGASWSMSQINIARSQPILHMQRMAAENPIWILSARAGEKNAD